MTSTATPEQPLVIDEQPVVIDLCDIGKSYQMADETFYALRDLNLQIRQNEYVAIIGPSGSGKSTLLNVLGCLDMPSQGHYQLAGHKVAELDETQLAILRNRQVGFIFQSFNSQSYSRIGLTGTSRSDGKNNIVY